MILPRHDGLSRTDQIRLHWACIRKHGHGIWFGVKGVFRVGCDLVLAGVAMGLLMKPRHMNAWLAVLREERHSISPITLMRAVFSGRVSSEQWKRRMAVCRRCPIFDRTMMRCRGPRVNGVDLGCGCYVPFLAKTRAPYRGVGGKGCWGRSVVGQRFGWGALEAE